MCWSSSITSYEKWNPKETYNVEFLGLNLFWIYGLRDSMLFNRMVNIIFALFLMMRFGYKQDCLDRAKFNTCSREKSPFFKCSKIVVRRKWRSLLLSLEIFMLDRSAKLFTCPFHLNYTCNTGFPSCFVK